ncbi:MAG: hypothetical protein ACYDC6_04280 [Acidobacteriaceae bacterium]
MTRAHLPQFRITLTLALFLATWFSAKAANSPGLTVTGPTSAIIFNNSSATSFNLTVTPVNGFTGKVQLLSCVRTSEPNRAVNPLECTSDTLLNPTPTITGANPVTIRLAIVTADAPKPAFTDRKVSLFPMGGEAVLACALLFLVPNRRRNWRAMLGLLFVMVTLVGCGSMGNRTTPGNYTFTATVADTATGKTKASCNFTVIVQ